jgi:Domain of unknown function (DUF5078)
MTNFADPLTASWPNWATIFFNNKGVAAEETDHCADYPPDDQSVWESPNVVARSLILIFVSYMALNRSGMSGDSTSWERRRTLRVLRGVGNRVLISPSSRCPGAHDWWVRVAVDPDFPLVLRVRLGTWWWR